MDFLQMSGSLLLLLSGVALGCSLNRGAGAVLTQIDAYVRLLRTVKREISCFALPIEEILLRTDPSILTGCGWIGEPPRSFSELLSRTPPKDSEGKRLLLAFSSEFGRGYREEQEALLDYYLSFLEAREDELRERVAGKKRVNLTLCSAGAAALVILFL
ncbi:MAG: hypothetical protein IKA76_06590 [Clostridia bacterium]|nr:hypothetical protein [Clostridia bacterium]